MVCKSFQLIFLYALIIFAPKLFSQGLSFTPAALVFTTPTLTTKMDSANLNITNNSCGYIKVSYSYCAVPEFKITDTSAFMLAPNASKSLQIKFFPHQNIEYNSQLILHTSLGDFACPIKGYGKFIESYWDSTYNKSEELLKTTLSTILSNGTLSFSYNAARDKMFMEIDNKKINGQGAPQNTLECIYTGRLAVGYIARSDCQTNFSFNTEHTWPQSLFSSNTPMVSDLNHLFPTDDAANNYRSNNPFGMVASPTWSVGGSKGISTLFEPRDAQKGRTARAMLYFATRYNNPAFGLVTFFGPQENILRTWCIQFLPDTIDRKRNEDIFGYQKNRNPYIDHPEFLERITSLTYNSVAPAKALIWCDTNSITKNYMLYDSVNFNVIIYNNGNANINCTKIQTTQNNFNVSFGSNIIARQSALEISLKKLLVNTNTIYDTLIVENSSSNIPFIKIPITLNIKALKISASKLNILFNGDSAVLTIATTGKVNWNFGNNGSSLTVWNAGDYFATVTDSAGCHQTDTVKITKSGQGINPKTSMNFYVYPNPAGDFIFVKNSESSSMNFFLINGLGQVVEQFVAPSNETTQINIRHLPAGIYYLQNEVGVGVKVVVGGR